MPAIMARLKKSHQALKAFKSNSVVDIEFLEGVAGMRFALMEIAGLMNAAITDHTPQPSQVMLLAKEVCADHSINTTTVGPAVYLIKLLVRQFWLPHFEDSF